jgi:hypothetical protein
MILWPSRLFPQSSQRSTKLLNFFVFKKLPLRETVWQVLQPVGRFPPVATTFYEAFCNELRQPTLNSSWIHLFQATQFNADCPKLAEFDSLTALDSPVSGHSIQRRLPQTGRIF